jgi:hypothetical protein
VQQVRRIRTLSNRTQSNRPDAANAAARLTTLKSAKSFACPASEDKCTKPWAQPKRLPSNGNHDMWRMRRNRPQREQMPNSSMQRIMLRMWPKATCESKATGLRLGTHKLPTSHLCPEHVCTLCNGEEEPKGHNNTTCPRAECQTCKLFGHVTKDCVCANCLDVKDDWANILFTKCESIVDAYFTEVSISAISLRTDGIVTVRLGPFSSWEQLQHKLTLSATQLLEIKLSTYNLKRDENRKYDQIVRRLNKPNESPINFAFTTDTSDYHNDDAVPKCPHCRTYPFPQEASKAMWCCKKRQILSLYKPWTQPTDEYRNHCIGNFTDARQFLNALTIIEPNIFVRRIRNQVWRC